MHWLYAGLTDGNYAQIVSPAPYREPLLVDFDLLKIHPLETDFGMGMPSMFYRGSSDWTKERDFHSPFFDRFIAATIAYGHIGYLTAEWGFPGTLKSYYLVQQLQRRYATDSVAEIKYERGGKLVSTSEALTSGAYKNGRVFVRYSRGLRLFVNYNEKSDWTISADGEKHLLPPFGFYAADGKGFIEYSKMVGRARVEFVKSPQYLYADTRGDFVRLPEIAARGALALKKENERLWWLVPATTCDDFCIYTDKLMPGLTVSQVKVTAIGENGADLGNVAPRVARGGLSFLRIPGAIKYRIEFLEEPEGPQPGFRLSLRSGEWKIGAGKSFPIQATVWNFSRSVLTDVLLRLTLEGEKPTLKEKRIKTSIAPHSGLSAEFLFKMPSGAASADRIWVRGEATGKIEGKETTVSAWLDFRPMPAIEVNFLPEEAVEIRPGGKVAFLAEITSHLRWDFSATIEISSGSPPRRTIARKTVLLRRGRPTQAPFALAGERILS